MESKKPSVFTQSYEEKTKLENFYKTRVPELCVIIKDKTMADILMYIPNNDTQNYPFYKLQLVIKTFGISTESTKQ